MGLPASTIGHFRQRTPLFIFEIIAFNFTTSFCTSATNNKENLRQLKCQKVF